jgi:hypothetical protein
LNGPEFTSGFNAGFFRIDRSRHDHEPNLEAVLSGKFEVAVVVRGNTHYRAGTVIHEDVVCYPNGNALSVEWIDGEMVGIDSVLFDGTNVAYLFGLALLGNQLFDLCA